MLPPFPPTSPPLGTVTTGSGRAERTVFAAMRLPPRKNAPLLRARHSTNHYSSPATRLASTPPPLPQAHSPLPMAYDSPADAAS